MSIKEVTGYRTSDGRIFESKAEAASHEKLADAVKDVAALRKAGLAPYSTTQKDTEGAKWIAAYKAYVENQL